MFNRSLGLYNPTNGLESNGIGSGFQKQLGLDKQNTSCRQTSLILRQPLRIYSISEVYRSP